MARFNLLKADREQEYSRNKAEAELYAAYTALEKACQLYQSTDMGLEQNFEKLIAGANENFIKRNISLLEFIDFYDSYKRDLHPALRNQKRTARYREPECGGRTTYF